MRLGVVMMGAGAHAAASVGVMQELARRHIDPFAVCGLAAGAWPAALYAAGQDAHAMEEAMLQAAGMGKRMLAPSASARRLLGGRAQALSEGKGMERLLVAQAGQRILSLCPRPALLLCRAARTGRPVIFSTRPYAQESGAMLTMQASVSFAARAAMAAPPLLSCARWMGTALLPEGDALLACRQLLALGAHRVLVIAPQSAPGSEADALEFALPVRIPEGDGALCAQVAVLRVTMPDGAGALAFEKMPACAQAGRRAAELGLDRAFEQLGMAFCRVLPFHRAQGNG